MRFELWSRKPSHARVQALYAVTVIFVGCGMFSLVWSFHQLGLAREAKAQISWKPSLPTFETSSLSSAQRNDALLAARLLETNVAAPLEELEACTPERAKLVTLSVNVLEGVVHARARFFGDPIAWRFDEFLECLKRMPNREHWRIERLDIQDSSSDPATDFNNHSPNEISLKRPL